MAPVIAVSNLHKRYRDGTHAVKGVSFQVEQGEIFGLLGPNGAGKTTTMRMLGTLHRPSKGQASVLGMDVQRQARRVRERIGFAMQEVGMDDLATAEEMLRFHARLYGLDAATARKRTRQLLRIFNLEKHARRRVTRFSGGMQRRLDLAVSIIHRPQVLFLDEPSTGLDPTSRSELWAILRRLRDHAGLTILLSTHYMEEADELCDRIGIMSEGKLVAIDTPENLKRSVGHDRIRMRLETAPDAGQAEAFEKEFGEDAVDVFDGTIELRVADGAAKLMKALQVATKQNLVVTSTRVLEPTLDDVFLRYTGSSLEEDQAEVAA